MKQARKDDKELVSLKQKELEIMQRKVSNYKERIKLLKNMDKSQQITLLNQNQLYQSSMKEPKPTLEVFQRNEIMDTNQKL